MWSFPLKHSLRAKVTLGVVLPLVLILGTFTAIEYARYRAAALDNLSVLASNSSQVIEASLRHAMLESDFTELQAVLDAVGDSENLEVVYLLDTSGRVIFAPDEEDVGNQLDNQQPDCQPCHRLPAASRPSSVVATTRDGQRVFRSMEPIENEPACAECHGSEERLRGLLLVDIPVAPTQASLNADLFENLLWWAGTILVTVLVVNVTLSQFVLRRLEGLAAGIAGLGLGRTPSPVVENQPDEIGHLARAFNAMVEQVQTRNTEKAELLRRLIGAQEEERKRISRELHDGTSQSLTSLLVGLDSVKDVLSRSDSSASDTQRIDELRQVVAHTLEEVHDLAVQLRPSILDDLGLPAALERLASDYQVRHSLHIDLAIHGLEGGRLEAPVETALYRIVQEALTNVVRHAEAKMVGVVVRRRDNTALTIVEDDGKGFDPNAVDKAGQRLGLIGIRERAELLGGRVTIQSGPGKGTTVFVEVPLHLQSAATDLEFLINSTADGQNTRGKDKG